jgi:hypothetical protein
MLISICALAGVAHGDTADAAAKKKAQEFYDLGVSAFDAGHYADALTDFRIVEQMAPTPGIYYTIAFCEEYTADFEHAYLHYQRFLEQAPANSAYRHEAQEELTRLEKLVKVSVPLSSTPPDAAVYVDGAPDPAGRTPTVLQLAQGKHELRLEAPHAKPTARSVDAVIGKITPIDVTLDQFGKVIIEADPDDAEIAGPGGLLGKGHFTQPDIPAGKLSFRVARAGYVTQPIDVDVEPGETVQMHVALVKDVRGALHVRAGGTATIYVDAVPIAVAAETTQPVILGSHLVTIDRPGYDPLSRRVDIEAGRTTLIDARLERDHSGTVRTAIWGLGSMGVAGILLGTMTGVWALEDRADYDRRPTVETEHKTNNRALESDLFYLGGIAAVAGAVAVWRYADRGHSQATVVQEPAP